MTVFCLFFFFKTENPDTSDLKFRAEHNFWLVRFWKKNKKNQVVVHQFKNGLLHPQMGPSRIQTGNIKCWCSFAKSYRTQFNMRLMGLCVHCVGGGEGPGRWELNTGSFRPGLSAYQPDSRRNELARSQYSTMSDPEWLFYEWEHHELVIKLHHYLMCGVKTMSFTSWTKIVFSFQAAGQIRKCNFVGSSTSLCTHCQTFKYVKGKERSGAGPRVRRKANLPATTNESLPPCIYTKHLSDVQRRKNTESMPNGFPFGSVQGTKWLTFGRGRQSCVCIHVQREVNIEFSVCLRNSHFSCFLLQTAQTFYNQCQGWIYGPIGTHTHTHTQTSLFLDGRGSSNSFSFDSWWRFRFSAVNKTKLFLSFFFFSFCHKDPVIVAQSSRWYRNFPASYKSYNVCAVKERNTVRQVSFSVTGSHDTSYENGNFVRQLQVRAFQQLVSSFGCVDQLRHAK